MKKFALPKLEIIKLVSNDIIKTSNESSSEYDLGIWQDVNEEREIL